ncbi:MAG: prepilin-type N-terminal cleavage/methylation domain-containing protein [Candidatus Nomurabacteria bacterium]|nr:prepilin-type N-terminal cleavage/methylation domain-containing protein [Candidatus Nomurabacteria bacterium]
MINFLLKTNKNSKGFTLVETLVAISIFTISILGMISILSNGITDTNYAKDKIIATYLAQEGVEFVRNVRDDSVLYNTTNSGWSDFLNRTTNCVPSGTDQILGCRMNDDLSTTDNFAACADFSSCELYINTGTNKYSSDPQSGDDSGFSRIITLNTGVSPNKVTITSNVSWMQKSGRQSVSFTEDLFNLY